MPRNELHGGAGVMTSVSQLHIRLCSCLQAILDLEPKLKELPEAKPLLTEFTALKEIYGRLDTLTLQEEDVKRIEEATVIFFAELKESIPQNATVHHDQKFLQ